MAKRRYSAPVWKDLTPEDPTIILTPSQDTTGQDIIFDFETDALKTLLQDYGYLVLEEIDEYGVADGFITQEEYDAWLAAQEN